MLTTTIDLIRAGLKSDPTVTPKDRAVLIALLREGKAKGKPPVEAPSNTPRLIRRKEAALRLGVSVRTVDKLCRDLALVKRTLPGRKRAVGILESDLNALLTGKAA